jgi:hypothetical protein
VSSVRTACALRVRCVRCVRTARAEHATAPFVLQGGAYVAARTSTATMATPEFEIRGRLLLVKASQWREVIVRAEDVMSLASCPSWEVKLEYARHGILLSTFIRGANAESQAHIARTVRAWLVANEGGGAGAGGKESAAVDTNPTAPKWGT